MRRRLTENEKRILIEAARIRRTLKEAPDRYWDKRGKYEDEAKELSRLVPRMGPAATIKGEIWRAARRIYHDFFNNGFGNDWAVHADLLMDNIDLPLDIIEILEKHKFGEPVELEDGHYDEKIERMIDLVVEQLRDFRANN
jgi:hypothetical protein